MTVPGTVPEAEIVLWYSEAPGVRNVVVMTVDYG
jgi:hypothetical protein